MLDCCPHPVTVEKMSTDGKTFVAGVFQSLYQEHPEHWSNGLSFRNFAPGESVYLVREKQASTPMGFVGWQQRQEQGKRIGYYSVGLLPEFRGKGYAKEAVAKLIAEKSAGVDEVRALIHHSNTASLHLATALGVPVTKCASMNKSSMLKAIASALTKTPLRRGLTGAGVGAGAGIVENETLLRDADPKLKAINLLSMAGLGAAAPGLPMSTIGNAFTGKQLGAYGAYVYGKDAPARQRIADTQLATAKSESSTANTLLEKAKAWTPAEKALAALGAAGVVGTGIYGVNSWLNRPKAKGTGKEVAPKKPSNKIRFDVPTSAVPPGFFEELMTKEMLAKGHPKYACLATREELMQELAADLQ